MGRWTVTGVRVQEVEELTDVLRGISRMKT